MFSHKELALRVPAKQLVHQAKEYNFCEQLLIRVAIDFWNRRGSTKLSDLLNEWDSELMIRFVHALCHFEEIKADARDCLITATDEPFVCQPPFLKKRMGKEI